MKCCRSVKAVLFVLRFQNFHFSNPFYWPPRSGAAVFRVQRCCSKSRMASARAFAMLSGRRSVRMAIPNAGGGSGVFSRSRNCVIPAIRPAGNRQSVKSPLDFSQTISAFPAIPSASPRRNPTFQSRSLPSSSTYVELNISRFMISKKLCGVKNNLNKKIPFYFT